MASDASTSAVDGSLYLRRLRPCDLSEFMLLLPVCSLLKCSGAVGICNVCAVVGSREEKLVITVGIDNTQSAGIVGA